MLLLPAIETLYEFFLKYPIVVTDTRKIQKGSLFFALKGPSFNGNDFALKALELGAAYCIVDEDINTPDEGIIRVEDVLKTLQLLALHHRKQFSIPFIVITGSNGKTTTKELLSTTLATTLKTYTTQGNLNNHIGVPLTILSIKKDAEIAVIEMGANHQKEIESYCAYTLPTHGIITNCGKAHLEGFGGVEGVKKGKGELFDFLANNDGVAFIFDDYEYLKEMSASLKNTIIYGTKKGEIQGHVSENNPFLKVTCTKGFNAGLISTQLVGDYNLSNVLAAVTVGKYFGVKEEDIKMAIEQYCPSNSRSQLIKLGTNNIVLDAYNANPTSMKAAIENFATIGEGNKVLMLGAMMEMGEDSILEHQQLVQLINEYTWNKVVLVGGDFKNIRHPFLYFENAVEAAEWFNSQGFEHSSILIKGSRSMQMEKILNQEIH